MLNTKEKLITLMMQAKIGWTKEEFATYLIANGVTLDNQVSSSKWIPVSERLPDIDLPCLCYKEVHGTGVYRLGKYLGATLSENCAAFKSMSHYGVIGVTHWMPLPQPPKEGE